MDKVIQEIVKKAKKDKKVLAVGFFGSYARGEKHPRDIDVCIFLTPECLKEEYFDLQLKYTPLSEKYDLQVFQALPLYIQEEIIEDAKMIYCKDDDILYDVLHQSQQQCEDFRPHFRAYLEVVLNGT